MTFTEIITVIGILLSAGATLYSLNNDLKTTKKMKGTKCKF